MSSIIPRDDRLGEAIAEIWNEAYQKAKELNPDSIPSVANSLATTELKKWLNEVVDGVRNNSPDYLRDADDYRKSIVGVKGTFDEWGELTN